VLWGEAKTPTKHWTHWGVATSRHIATQDLDLIQAVGKRARAFRRRKIGIAGLGVDSNLLARGRACSGRAEGIIEIVQSDFARKLEAPQPGSRQWLRQDGAVLSGTWNLPQSKQFWNPGEGAVRIARTTSPNSALRPTHLSPEIRFAKCIIA